MAEDMNVGSARLDPRSSETVQMPFASSCLSCGKDAGLIEITWGKPLTFVVSSDGNVQKFSMIEQGKFGLQNKWPVADDAHREAPGRVERAMACIVPLAVVRRSSIAASRLTALVHGGLMTCPQGHPA